MIFSAKREFSSNRVALSLLHDRSLIQPLLQPVEAVGSDIKGKFPGSFGSLTIEETHMNAEMPELHQHKLEPGISALGRTLVQHLVRQCIEVSGGLIPHLLKITEELLIAEHRIAGYIGIIESGLMESGFLVYEWVEEPLIGGMDSVVDIPPCGSSADGSLTVIGKNCCPEVYEVGISLSFYHLTHRIHHITHTTSCAFACKKQ